MMDHLNRASLAASQMDLPKAGRGMRVTPLARSCLDGEMGVFSSPLKLSHSQDFSFGLKHDHPNGAVPFDATSVHLFCLF